MRLNHEKKLHFEQTTQLSEYLNKVRKYQKDLEKWKDDLNDLIDFVQRLSQPLLITFDTNEFNLIDCFFEFKGFNDKQFYIVLVETNVKTLQWEISLNYVTDDCYEKRLHLPDKYSRNILLEFIVNNLEWDKKEIQHLYH